MSGYCHGRCPVPSYTHDPFLNHYQDPFYIPYDPYYEARNKMNEGRYYAERYDGKGRRCNNGEQRYNYGDQRCNNRDQGSFNEEDRWSEYRDLNNNNYKEDQVSNRSAHQKAGSWNVFNQTGNDTYNRAQKLFDDLEQRNEQALFLEESDKLLEGGNDFEHLFKGWKDGDNNGTKVCGTSFQSSTIFKNGKEVTVSKRSKLNPDGTVRTEVRQEFEKDGHRDSRTWAKEDAFKRGGIDFSNKDVQKQAGLEQQTSKNTPDVKDQKQTGSEQQTPGNTPDVKDQKQAGSEQETPGNTPDPKYQKAPIDIIDKEKYYMPLH